MKHYLERNRALLHFVVLPTMLLTVALLGGLRINAQTKQFHIHRTGLLPLLNMKLSSTVTTGLAVLGMAAGILILLRL